MNTSRCTRMKKTSRYRVCSNDTELPNHAPVYVSHV